MSQPPSEKEAAISTLMFWAYALPLFLLCALATAFSIGYNPPLWLWSLFIALGIVDIFLWFSIWWEKPPTKEQ